MAEQAAGGGRIAVIAAEERVVPLAQALRADAALGRVGTGSGGVDDAIGVMTAQDAKGLEFDAVTLVEPGELLTAHERGAGDLYVAMTRPTQRLDVVHAAPLPGALERALQG